MTDPTRISDDQHNNAPAVPQGWAKAADQVPLEADGEVFIRFTDGSIGTGWATYWHGASNEFAQWTFPDPDEDRLVSEWAKNVPASPGMHWTENEPVRLPHARAGRVYLAGPMTGISELNFPAFNQEAERLRAEGLQVLNPADHGIVDGADWADYLRHDIAGLSSCERIHLLRGWTKSKGACLEMTIAKALGMTVTYQVDAEIEHNNAPAVPQGWPLGELSNGQIIATVVRMGELVNYLKLGQQWDGICNLVRQIIRERYTLAATPAHAPSKGAVGFGARALAAELAEAALKDDNDPEGHDISAGLFGPNVSAWLRKVASEYLAPAHAPAQEQCNACLGTGRMVRDPDIGTDQECFVCDGSGYEPAQEVGLTDEELEECFRRAHEEINTAYVPTARFPIGWRLYGRQVIAALRAKEQA